MTNSISPDRGATRVCARCHASVDDIGACPWCGHDPSNEVMVADLSKRHERLLELRQDSTARKAWLIETGAHPFMSCPACGQWGRESDAEPVWRW